MGDQLMYDGIGALAAGIAKAFPDAGRVAGYLNGQYAWTAEQWALFPHADKVTITVSAELVGDVLDVEGGDATPGQAAGWITARKAAGLYRPTIYCSRSVIPAVRAGTGSYVLGRDYDIWVADYTGSAHEVTAPGSPAVTCAATQYESTADWDASAVYDDGWPHRTPPGPAAPSGPSWPAGVTLRAGDSGDAVRVLQQALHDSGAYGARGLVVDGVFGVRTTVAVENFQSDRHLTVDGIAGPATRAALGV